MAMKRIGIVGSRRRNSEEDYKLLEKKFLEIYEDGDEIVSGGCSKGADNMASQLAKKYQVTIKIYYAQWDKLGKSAGFARNKYIAQDADILICMVSRDRLGGTENTIKTAKKLGKKIILLEQVLDKPKEKDIIDELIEGA